MGTIFVSHSRHDKDLVNNFALICARAGLQANLMELENLENKYAGKEISKIIQTQSYCVVVLLGPNLASPPTDTPQYTHNWVNFEVGVAIGCGKEVWVFEELGKNIPFPIPYVTHYVKYEVRKSEHIREAGDLLNAFYKKKVRRQPFSKNWCPYENCGAVYNVYLMGDDEEEEDFEACPVCRRNPYDHE